MFFKRREATFIPSIGTIALLNTTIEYKKRLLITNKL